MFKDFKVWFRAHHPTHVRPRLILMYTPHAFNIFCEFLNKIFRFSKPLRVPNKVSFCLELNENVNGCQSFWNGVFAWSKIIIKAVLYNFFTKKMRFRDFEKAWGAKFFVQIYEEVSGVF